MPKLLQTIKALVCEEQLRRQAEGSSRSDPCPWAGMAIVPRCRGISRPLCTAAVLIAAVPLSVWVCVFQAGTAKMKGQDWNAAKCVVEGGAAPGAHCMVVVKEEDAEAVFPC